MNQVLNAVRDKAVEAGVFAEIKITSKGVLQCSALGSAEPAWYRLDSDNGLWHVSLVTADRWLSESIEADLMHYGDPLEELIEEELAEQGYTGSPLAVKHYRSDDMLYTFRSEIALSPADAKKPVAILTQCLLAYEAAFRPLGDMNAEEE